MSNAEGEQRDREAQIAAAQNEGRSGSGDHLESLDRSDPAVVSPTADPSNPHAQNPDLGQAQMQERVDRMNEKGYMGGTPDPTPDVNYTLLTPPDAPTPETDPDLKAQVDANVRGNTLVNTGLTTAQTGEGAEPVPPAEGTTTPGVSQAQQPPPVVGTADTTTLTEEESAEVQSLVAGGTSEEDAKAQVLAKRGGAAQ